MREAKVRARESDGGMCIWSIAMAFRYCTYRRKPRRSGAFKARM